MGWAELKCTGLLPDGDGGRRAKERLVICMINYGGNSASKIPCVVEETAETSHAFQKLLSILLVFYDYAKVSRPEELMDLPIRLVDIWAPAPSDIALFKRDWEVIQGYVRDGRAHELTEGLTPMLGACTKSSDSTKMVKQRAGKALAKPRAFALKQAYVTEIFRSLYSEQAESKLMESPSPGYAKVYFEQDLESEILSRVNAYVGMTTIEICKRLKLEAKFGGKSGHSRRIRAFLNTISMKLYALPVEDLEPFRFHVCLRMTKPPNQSLFQHSIMRKSLTSRSGKIRLFIRIWSNGSCSSFSGMIKTAHVLVWLRQSSGRCPKGIWMPPSGFGLIRLSLYVPIVSKSYLLNLRPRPFMSAHTTSIATLVSSAASGLTGVTSAKSGGVNRLLR
jgi:DNA mismatch repair enzyme MutH